MKKVKLDNKSLIRCFGVKYRCLLYRQECFSGKLTTRKVHTKLHPGLEWSIFHILTSEVIDDVISRSYTFVCAKILLSI